MNLSQCHECGVISAGEVEHLPECSMRGSTATILKGDFAGRVERQLVDALKKTMYEYSGRMTVATALGCLEIVKQEVFKEQMK